MTYHNLSGEHVIGSVAFECIERLWEGGGQAVALNSGKELRNIDIEQLQKQLVQQSQILDHKGLLRHPRASMFQVASVEGHVSLQNKEAVI